MDSRQYKDTFENGYPGLPMQVILKQRLENLGHPGDVVNVKNGYARNYLIPQGFAYEATNANLKRIDRERAVIQRKSEEELTVARASAGVLEGTSVTFTARAGE